MPENPQPFTGNSIFLKDGSPVIPDNAIAQRLRAGNFGPAPNNTAPPGYVLPPSITPQMMALALRSGILPNIGGQRPPPPSPPAAPQVPSDPVWMPDRSW